MEELQKLKLLVLELQQKILQLEESLDTESRARKSALYEYEQALRRLDENKSDKYPYQGVKW